MAVPKLDFDIVKDLEDAGASQELAKAVVRAIADKTVAGLATKSDLAELRADLAEIRAAMATKEELAETQESLRAEISEVRESLRAEMTGLRATMATKDELAETRESLRAEMASLELRLTEKMSAMFTKVIIWLVGTAIASVTLMATIVQLLK